MTNIVCLVIIGAVFGVFSGLVGILASGISSALIGAGNATLIVAVARSNVQQALG